VRRPVMRFILALTVVIASAGAFASAASAAASGAAGPQRPDEITKANVSLSLDAQGRVVLSVVGASRDGVPLATTARVSCGRTAVRGSGARVVDGPAVFHEIVLPGTMGASQRWYYDVRLDATLGGTGASYHLWLPEAGSRYSFVTPPGTNTGAATMAFFGDNRPYSTRLDDLVPPAFPAVAAGVAASGASLCVGVGDYILAQTSYTNFDGWPDLPDTLQSLGLRYQGFFAYENAFAARMPTMLALGNHEEVWRGAAFPGAQAWSDWFAAPGDAATYYSFDWGPFVHVVVLDTGKLNKPFGFAGPGQPGNSVQCQWLIDDLQANIHPWTIVALHYPLYDGSYAGGVGDYWSDPPQSPEAAAERDRIVQFFHDQGVDVVMEGHRHYYRRHMHDGTPYVIQGAGGAQEEGIYPDVDDAAYWLDPGFSTITFSQGFVKATLKSYKTYGTRGVSPYASVLGDRLVLTNNPKHAD